MTHPQKYRAFLARLRELGSSPFRLVDLDVVVRMLLDIPDRVPTAARLFEARARTQAREQRRLLRESQRRMRAMLRAQRRDQREADAWVRQQMSAAVSAMKRSGR